MYIYSFFRGWYIADPVIAILIAIFMTSTALPRCKKTAMILLQTTPINLKDTIDKAVREICTMEGVLECTHQHFWAHSSSNVVGSLHLRIRSDANEQTILFQVYNIFTNLVTHLTIQIEKDDLWVLPTSSNLVTNNNNQNNQHNQNNNNNNSNINNFIIFSNNNQNDDYNHLNTNNNTPNSSISPTNF